MLGKSNDLFYILRFFRIKNFPKHQSQLSSLNDSFTAHYNVPFHFSNFIFAIVMVMSIHCSMMASFNKFHVWFYNNFYFGIIIHFHLNHSKFLEFEVSSAEFLFCIFYVDIRIRRGKRVNNVKFTDKTNEA